MSFRSLDGSEPKYLHLPGDSRVFNGRAIHEADDTLCVAEGQMDAITLEVCGFHSIGILGASAWKPHHSRMVAGFTRVLVFGDGDSAGTEFSRKVSNVVPDARVVPMPPGQDVNSLYVEHGPDAIRELVNNV